MNVTLEQNKKNLEAIADQITRMVDCAKEIAPNRQELLNDLDEQRKKTTEKFMVLVVGVFNAGKSSMLNAFAGKELFPTGLLPETGVITEIEYGQELTVTLYPKEPNEQPTVLKNPSVEQIKKHSSIDNLGQLRGVTTENVRYERNVFQCDLPLLKDGIVLVDTVGMNDPWGNDYITKRYFPKADAIIYLMNCAQIYSKEDKALLSQINASSHRNLIIAYTHFDEVLKVYRRKPQSAVDEFCNIARAHAANHTDIGREGIHFIDSIGGLEGKETDDETLVIRSGIAGLEQFCYSYLLEHKGVDRILVIQGIAAAKTKELKTLAQTIKTGATTDSAELLERVEKSKEQLEAARAKSAANAAGFRMRVEQSFPHLEMMIRNHLSSCADSIDIDDYEFENELPHGLKNLAPGARSKAAKAITQECITEYERRMKTANDLWITTKLQSTIQDLTRQSLEEIGAGLCDFYEQLDSVNVTLNGIHQQQATKRSVTDIVTGVLYTVLTGDIFGGATAVAYGKNALLKVLAAQVTAGFAIGLLALATGLVITVSGLVIASILSSIVALLINNNESQARKIKEQTIKKLRETYENDTEGIERNAKVLYDACCNLLRLACDRFDAMMQHELDEATSNIQAAIEAGNKQAGEKEQLAASCDRVCEELDSALEAINDICKQYQ